MVWFFNRRRGVSEEDLRRREKAEKVAEHQRQRTDEVHGEITSIILHNHIGDMLQASIMPKKRKGRS